MHTPRHKASLSAVIALTAIAAFAGCATSAESPAPRPPAVPASLGTEAFEIANVSQRPRPIQQVQPRYPVEMRRVGATGEAIVEFIVGSDGNVYNAVAVRASHEAFAQAAVAAVSAWKFNPAKIDGRPVNCRMQVPIVFSLNNR